MIQNVSQVEFVQLIESGALIWPPFEAGGFIYSLRTGGGNLVRTAAP